MSDTVKKISSTVKKLAKVLTAEDLPLDIREMKVTGPKPSYKSYPNKEERLLAIQEFSPEVAGLVGELYKNIQEADRLANAHKKQVNDLKAQLEGERAPVLSDIQSGAQTIFTTMERNGIAFNEYMEAFSVVGEYFLSLRKQTEQPGREIPPGDSAKIDFILKYLGEKLPEVLSLVQSALKEWEAAATVTSAPTQVPPGVGVMKMGSKKVRAGIIDWLKGFFRSFMSGSKKFQRGAEILKGLTSKLSPVTASKKHRSHNMRTGAPGNPESRPHLETSKVSPVKSVIIERAEGPNHLCGKPNTFTGPDAIKQASAWMYSQAYTFPKTGGYDKHDVKVTWEDGETAEIRLDAKHPSQPNNDLDVGQHLYDFLSFYAGRRRPGHLSEDSYKQALSGINGEEYGTFLDTHAIKASKKHKADLGDFTFTNYETKVVFLALSSLKNESLREAVIKDKDPNRAKSAARHLAAAGVQNQLGLDLINSALSHVKWDEINRALGKEWAEMNQTLDQE